MKQYRVTPDERVHLRDAGARETGEYPSGTDVAARVEQLRQKLDALQERLYAEGARALLVILQGIDTSGKDSLIRRVMSGLNPQGCVVTSFKTPTPIEDAHDFLWRSHAACPTRGSIGIFNRSYYEAVLITRVHGMIDDDEVHRRLKAIHDFERMLTRNGTRILKFFLHISKDEQKSRLLSRVDHLDKRWKLNPQDVIERGHWDAYQRAFELMLSSSSTKEAPWFVVPADHHWYRDVVVAEQLVGALEDMDPRPPTIAGIDYEAIRRALMQS